MRKATLPNAQRRKDQGRNRGRGGIFIASEQVSVWPSEGALPLPHENTAQLFALAKLWKVRGELMGAKERVHLKTGLRRCGALKELDTLVLTVSFQDFLVEIHDLETNDLLRQFF